NKNYYNKSFVEIKPNQSFMLMNEKIFIAPLATINGKTTMFKLNSDGPLYVAELAMFKRSSIFSTDDTNPDIDEWISLLNNSNVSEKRDHIPTPLNINYQGIFYYSRVSGVVKGNKWDAKIINENDYFKIPNKSKGVAYALNNVYNHTFGTNQAQSGNVIKRYSDTAYQSHANYGVTYDIEIPLYNLNQEATSVAISFDSPIRTVDDIRQDKVSYYENPPEKITFRGDFKVEYQNSLGNIVKKYIHVVQRSGQSGLPLVSIFMQPGDKRNVKISYVYPADCTPPHILTITSN
ncbi:MAG: DUF3370 family protein, partial [Candidatus Sericytochromatia bacterium]|nr:DUF3370 family protein [Candidatus Sericytochromatia bacterium]